MMTNILGNSQRFPAHGNLAQQLDWHECYLCSLDELWRACGSPAGRDPATWLDFAFHIALEMADHLRQLQKMLGKPNRFHLKGDQRDAFREWPKDAEPVGGWQVGDTLAIPPLANLYAIYLDASIDP